MKLPRRRPAVEPALRKEWYRRNQDLGESAVDIARKDGYDVRTVKKQLELQREEVERKAIRASFLRDALEKHHQDLCTAAEKLGKAISSDASVSGFKDELLYQALQQHTPRWNLWKNIKKWEELLEEKKGVKEELGKSIVSFIEKEPSIGFADNTKEGWDKAGIIDALVYYIDNLSKGYLEPFGKEALEIKNKDIKLNDVYLSRYHIACVSKGKIKEVSGIVTELMDKVANWALYQRLGELNDKLAHIKKEIQSDLSTILLRRVLPGSCRYCPI